MTISLKFVAYVPNMKESNAIDVNDPNRLTCGGVFGGKYRLHTTGGNFVRANSVPCMKVRKHIDSNPNRLTPGGVTGAKGHMH